ncbi:MAG: hypothetical protein H7Y12_10595 [Sphingobacteriaceae bacterium]|nr:hypothetical protein [Cytophagaceae bacterium]
MNDSLAKAEVSPKTGEEPFLRQGAPLPVNLLDFWRWSGSDLLNNAQRGVLAEFIVAQALGLSQGVRTEWDAYDLLTTAGVRVEVKSAAYLQSWAQRKFSSIQFSIRPTKRWDELTNRYENDLRRQGEVYVFCLLSHQDKTKVNPLDLDQWVFYVVSAKALNEKFPVQKSIRLSVLLATNPICATFEKLADGIDRVLT